MSALVSLTKAIICPITSSHASMLLKGRRFELPFCFPCLVCNHYKHGVSRFGVPVVPPCRLVFSTAVDPSASLSPISLRIQSTTARKPRKIHNFIGQEHQGIRGNETMEKSIYIKNPSNPFKLSCIAV